MTFCRICGRMIPDDSAFCPGCGTQVEEAEKAAEAVTETAAAAEETVVEAATETAAAAEETVVETAAAAEETVEKAAETAETVTEAAAETVADTAEEATEMVSEPFKEVLPESVPEAKPAPAPQPAPVAVPVPAPAAKESEEQREKAKNCMILAIVGAALSEWGLPGLIVTLIARKRLAEYTEAYGAYTGMAKAGYIITRVAKPVSIFFTVFWGLYIMFFAIYWIAVMTMMAGSFSNAFNELFNQMPKIIY